MKSKIEINNTELTIRPSSVDSALGCGYQWARVFLTGETSIPNARASIGTGVHSGAERLWQDAMKANDKGAMYLAGAVDAAVESFKEEAKKGLRFDAGEDINTAISEVVSGVNVFLEDIVPFVAIPRAVEKRYTIPIQGHPIVKNISGTLDYIEDGISDLKTSKRTASPYNYEIQQSIYKILAEANGEDVAYNTIQNVVLTKVPKGAVLDMPVNVEKAKVIVNNLIERLEVLATDTVKPEILFPGNPKYFLCSEKYCAFYNDCMFVKGESPDKKSATVVKL